MALITNEEEYKQLQRDLEDNHSFLQEEIEELRLEGVEATVLERVFRRKKRQLAQMEKDIQEYENIFNGLFDPSHCKDHELGRHLIKCRLYKRMTQTQLAEKLGVTQPAVARDERNEYAKIGFEKLQRICRAMDINLHISIHEVNAAENETSASRSA